MVKNDYTKKDSPRLIAWEVTRRCNLKCKHCRADACDKEYPDELTTEECFRLLKNIASFSKPIIILTGGEPMFRNDIYDIASYGTTLGLKMVMAPCGHLITKETAKKIIACGIQRISLSLDGPDASTHDDFRQIPGAFNTVMNATQIANETGLEFQINSTITKHNYKKIQDIFNMSVRIGAKSFHPFLLVPMGRGKDLADYEIAPHEYEHILSWFYEASRHSPIHLKPTCAPHYYRIFRQKEHDAGRTVSFETHGMDAMTKGCMGGQSFAFISHTGLVQICGFLELPAGNLKENNFDFKSIWEHSPLFRDIRNINEYHGRCGICEYRKICGGCRARAYHTTGHYLDEEPYCIYEPKHLAQ